MHNAFVHRKPADLKACPNTFKLPPPWRDVQRGDNSVINTLVINDHSNMFTPWSEAAG